MRLNGQKSESNYNGEYLNVQVSYVAPDRAFLAVGNDEPAECGIWLTHRQTIALRDKLTEILGDGEEDTADTTERPEIEEDD